MLNRTEVGTDLGKQFERGRVMTWRFGVYEAATALEMTNWLLFATDCTEVLTTIVLRVLSFSHRWKDGSCP